MEGAGRNGCYPRGQRCDEAPARYVGADSLTRVVTIDRFQMPRRGGGRVHWPADRQWQSSWSALPDSIARAMVGRERPNAFAAA